MCLSTPLIDATSKEPSYGQLMLACKLAEKLLNEFGQAVRKSGLNERGSKLQAQLQCKLKNGETSMHMLEVDASISNYLTANPRQECMLKV